MDLGYYFGGPHNKDYSILGSILGFPYFGKVPFGVLKTLKAGPLISCLRLPLDPASQLPKIKAKRQHVGHDRRR